MTQPSWRVVAEGLSVPARPEGGMWTLALEYVTGPRKLKIAARGVWRMFGEKECGPDGEGFGEAMDKCLASTAARGSLLAKVGGGTADKSGSIFPVGRIAVIELPEPASAAAVRGALFLGMNDDPRKFADHSGEIAVDIWEAY